MPDNWKDLEDEDKVDRLTDVLTLAATDRAYREQCLMSPRSARAAVEKVADVTLPTGMTVRFMTIDEAEEESLMILKLPKFGEEVEADKEHWPCTYTIYTNKPEP